ncbi:MAG: dienelactone hydrolase family protein [Patescibacteria group bacterium]|nr:dienelactone hydrolase family protein [Patescibacteria group bacterium]
MLPIITVKTAKGDVGAIFSAPETKDKVPAIILIHEVWGLNDNIKDIAGRLAGEGYAVLAPDLISQTGITEQIGPSILKEIANPDTKNEAQKKMREAMAPLQNPEFGRDTILRLEGCYNFLLSSGKTDNRIATVGFCFGGTYAWNMAIHQPGLAAAVAFYGHAPLDEDELSNISCPILAFYGERDENLVKQLPRLREIMDRLDKDFDYLVYKNAGHAFFNHTNLAAYNREAAEDSWVKTLAFLEKAMER